MCSGTGRERGRAYERAVNGRFGVQLLLFATLAVIALSVAAAPAYSQTTVPSPAEPGKIEERFEEPRSPESGDVPIVPAPEEALPPEEFEQIRFTLQGVRFVGVTVYEEGELRSLYEERLGSEVSLSEVFQIANAATTKYRDDGYILSRAVVPQQEIEDGVVRIQVVEGYVDEIAIEGDTHGSDDLLRAYGNKIKASRPVHVSDFERYLLLANDLPGMDVQAVLQPADAAGAASITLVVEHDRFEPFLRADNRGTRFLGPYQLQGGSTFNSVLGLNEETLIRGIVTQQPTELRFYEARHKQQLGTEGTTAEGFASFTQTRPGFTLRGLNVRGESIRGGVTLEHPFVRRRSESLYGTLTLDAQNSTTDVLGVNITDDRLRSLRIGARYDFVDAWQGVNLIGAEVNQGLPVAGERGNSRAFGRTDYTSVDVNASRLQRITSNVSALFAVTGQYAASQLLSPEEFSFGGQSFGRAFDPAEIVGDHGFAGQVELRYTDQVTLEDWDELFDTYQLYAFYDWGRVWRIESTGRGAQDTGASAGVGLRVNTQGPLNFSVELAKPLIRDVGSLGTEGDNWRGFFQAGMRF